MNAIQVKAQKPSGFLGVVAGSVVMLRTAWATLSTAKRSWWWVAVLLTILVIIFTVVARRLSRRNTGRLLALRRRRADAAGKQSIRFFTV